MNDFEFEFCRARQLDNHAASSPRKFLSPRPEVTIHCNSQHCHNIDIQMFRSSMIDD